MQLSKPQKRILVLCTGNSCRSQIAEGYLRYFGGGLIEVYSAGVKPHGLHPKAVLVMAEDQIDISMQTSDSVEQYAHMAFDVVITVCDHAKEQCPIFPNAKRRVHQRFGDPAGATGSEEEALEVFRQVRDAIRDFSQAFTAELLRDLREPA